MSVSERVHGLLTMAWKDRDLTLGSGSVLNNPRMPCNVLHCCDWSELEDECTS